MIKKLGIILYAVFAVMATIFAGCASLTPTRKPPLTDVLGYSVPSWKGWTFVGLNESIYNIEVKKLDTWRIMIDVVNRPALEAREQAIDLWSMIATGGLMGGLPMALRKVPKGYKKDENAS